MAVLPLTQGVENPILRTVSKPVKNIDKKIKKLVDDMIDTMEDADGLGIAAPQVGVNLRIYIARLNYNTNNEMIVPMINAELVELSRETDDEEEGCLSIPKKFGVVNRSKTVTVRYRDIKNREVTLHLDGLNARIMQHEMDHLNATLIADRWIAPRASGDKPQHKNVTKE